MMPPPNNSRKAIAPNLIELPAKLENLPLFMTFVCDQARQFDFTDKRTLEIELVLEEALVNVIEYAYPTERPGRLILHLEGKADGKLHLEIRDKGVLFNPLERAAPDLEAELMERPIGGLGIFLMKELTDGISWHRKDDENCLSIIFEPRHVK
ncbi:MAG: ATP-binding protein [Pseudomonadota bacterium]|nr:ATP-binding protein [Pseudomonadota bacterium]